MVVEKFMASFHKSAALGKQTAQLVFDDTALTKD
jgi:hypothetical protein